MDLAEVGKRLKAVRDHLSLSMEKLRQITGYSKALISAAEKGQKKPSAIYLYALFDKFNVNIHYIFSGSGSMFLDEDTENVPVDSPGVETADVSADPTDASMDDDSRELFYLIENVDMVRYAMLSHFIQYKTENHLIINQLLEEKRRKREQDAGSEAPGKKESKK